MKSNGTKKSKFSPGEERVLDLLIKRSGKPILSTDLIERFYGKRERPANARVTIGGIIRSLVMKTKSGKVRVKRSERRGPRPIEVWAEQR